MTTGAASTLRILEGAPLVPEPWRRPGWERAHVFNPAIVTFGGETLLAWRVVLDDGIRRLAACRLDGSLRPVPGSVVTLSDLLEGAGDWHADPRFLVRGRRLYLHFNDGARRPNRIFLVEIDPATLAPLAAARTLELQGPRQVVEKNWLPFVTEEGEVLAVHRIAPHVVLRLDLEAAGPVPCRLAHETPWDPAPYAARHGTPRGGTPPVRVGDRWFSFFHSVHPAPRIHRAWNRLLHGKGARVRRYSMGFYGFAGRPPFRPVCFTPAPVLEAPPRARDDAPPLNRTADRVAYPCGATFRDGTWTVSLGLQDDRCALATFSHADLLARTVPVAGA